MRTFYVYILTSVNRKVMYVGVIVHAEEYRYIEDAISREKEIKGWRRSKKDELVESTNPSWADLFETIAVIDPSLRSG